jgi:hypothetical protein
MDSGEGNGVSGTRSVMLNTSGSLPNTNTFIGISFEGNGWEYQIECYGLYNTFVNCRFEASLGAKVYWRASANRNSVLQGYGALTPTYEAGAIYNNIEQNGRQRYLSSGVNAMIVCNTTSGANGAFTVMDPNFPIESGTDPTTGYAWTHSALLIKGKRSGDSFDRVQVDANAGRILFGDGTGTPTAALAYGSSGLLQLQSATLYPNVDNATDLGINATRFRIIRARTALITGTFATGSRPVPATGAGTMVFDTTLNKPIWSDGTNWRDATGTIV